MVSLDTSKEPLITCPKCKNSYTLSYVKENNHASHTGGLYCPDCYGKIDNLNPTPSNNNKSTCSEHSFEGKVIAIIDDYLVKSEKEYTSLGQINKILSQKNIITLLEKNEGKVKQMLEGGKIPHAYQTEKKPRQWRIPLSENGRILFETHQKEKFIASINALPKESIADWYNGFSDKEKKGFKRLAFIVVASIIIILATLLPDNSSNSSNTYYTKSGYVAGVNKSAFNMAMECSMNSDQGCLNQLINSGQAIHLTNGQQVVIVKSRFGSVEIRPIGATYTLWTVKEAISKK